MKNAGQTSTPTYQESDGLAQAHPRGAAKTVPGCSCCVLYKPLGVRDRGLPALLNNYTACSVPASLCQERDSKLGHRLRCALLQCPRTTLRVSRAESLVLLRDGSDRCPSSQVNTAQSTHDKLGYKGVAHTDAGAPLS